MKKGIAIAVFCIICLTRIKVGYVGVVYSAKGVEQNTLTQTGLALAITIEARQAVSR